ncbi:MAG: hypothetical protein P4L84_24820 [Isosphaeraceae bacterium]|nr:hypothetical protein [Isosphaeraceae bacterium]
MNWRSGHCLLFLAFFLVLSGVPSRTARAQMYGFGPGGYGVAGAYYGGFGHGYPAVVFGSPYPRYGFGYGYGGYGYSYPGYGYSYGYPGMGYSGMGYGYGNFPYVPTLTTSGAPYVNPLFGVGLSPLGVNSALSERYMLGRGSTSYYVRSYAPGTPQRPAAATPVPRTR